MKSSYMDYAMSVIVGRALPDARDGLKPVHRRVLYSMNENGLQPTSLSAERLHRRRGNGQVPPARRLGDLRHPGQARPGLRHALPARGRPGELGSIDDDPAAAMRYTEARLSRIATEMLRDLDADTVDFTPNYDGSQQEPLVLPVRFPTCWSTARGDRSRHGDQHPAPQPAGDHRRDHRVHRERRDRRRGPDEAHEGAGLPDRRDHPRPSGIRGGLPRRPRTGAAAGARTSSRSSRARRPSSSPSFRTWSRRAATVA